MYKYLTCAQAEKGKHPKATVAGASINRSSLWCAHSELNEMQLSIVTHC